MCRCTVKILLVHRVELLIVECTEVDVDEGEDRPGHHRATCPIGEVVGHLVGHGEVAAVDVETSEIMVLGCRTAFIRAKTVSGVLLTVIRHETMAG